MLGRLKYWFHQIMSQFKARHLSQRLLDSDSVSLAILRHSALKNVSRIGIIGDSVAFGLKAEFNFGQYIQKATGAMIENLAVSGAHLSDNGFTSIYQQAHRLQPADLFILQGTDDDWLANVPLGDGNASRQTYIGAFYQTIAYLQQLNPKAVILVITPTYQTAMRGARVRRTERTLNALGLDLHGYVRAQLKACQALGVPVVNLMQTRLFDPSKPQFRAQFMRDGLHPNGTGHRRIAKLIANTYNKAVNPNKKVQVD
ncbi:SGNH/GDSL hydrolase family protein [Leuconostoc holzapfelii]|uniref:SGNH/GDSL hydrolase family protein n=2 Tax=Leuconostoc holzapfelii TaxID=434464 RepID=A0ABT2NWI5_9LACO|nr:SGNH/GDSL hydrolase family protein [Leuconostoc holzapfelii]